MSTTDNTNAARRGSGSNDLLGLEPERAALERLEQARTQARLSATLADRFRQELFATAAQLDDWATQSQRGGWSTHQVEPMRRKADALRRVASLKA